MLQLSSPYLVCMFRSSQLQAETKRCLWAHGLLAFLKKDLCGRLWRAGHHPVVEGLRRALSQEASPEDKEGKRGQNFLHSTATSDAQC